MSKRPFCPPSAVSALPFSNCESSMVSYTWSLLLGPGFSTLEDRSRITKIWLTWWMAETASLQRPASHPLPWKAARAVERCADRFQVQGIWEQVSHATLRQRCQNIALLSLYSFPSWFGAGKYGALEAMCCNEGDTRAGTAVPESLPGEELLRANHLDFRERRKKPPLCYAIKTKGLLEHLTHFKLYN